MPSRSIPKASASEVTASSGRKKVVEIWATLRWSVLIDSHVLLALKTNINALIMHALL
jgi:hypothetical protein